MDTTLRKLTLVCPAIIEPTLVDCLDTLDPPVSGYSVFKGEGRGANMNLASSAERVRGSMQVVSVQMILPDNQIEPVLEAVKNACPRPHLAFWVEPVLDFGRLQ